LEFSKVKSEGKTVFWTSVLVSMSNFVPKRATVTELWPLNQISDGGRRHLDFTSGVSFGHMTIFRL